MIDLLQVKSQVNRAVRKGAILSVSVLSLGTLGLPAHANLVVNGSFTAPIGQTDSYTLSGTTTLTSNLPNWFMTTTNTPSTILTCLVVGGASDMCGTGYLYPTGHAASFNVDPDSPPGGTNYIVSDANPVASEAINQTLSGLTVGARYTVSFDQGSASEYGDNDSSQENWQVSLGGQTQTSALMSTAADSATPWAEQTLSFTATAASETLQFLAVEPQVGGPPLALLANVDVEVPEPASVALVGVSVLAMGLLGICKTRKSATVLPTVGIGRI